MSPNLTLFYVFALILTALISSVVAYLVWQRRSAPGSVYLALLLAAVAEWSLSAAIETLTPGQGGKITWAKIEYLGAHSAAPFLLLFVARYIHRDEWITWRNQVILWTVPILTVLLAASNEWHHLIWTGFSPGPAGSNLLIYHHGPWFWFSVVFIYLVLFTATALLLRATLRSADLYHQQTPVYLAAVFAPWLAASLYLSGLTPLPGMDITPAGFMATGVILAWGISRTHLLDLAPVARDTLVESMSDSVLVLDAQYRLIDFNAAAASLVGCNLQECIGQPAETALPFWPDIAPYCGFPEPKQAEINLSELNNAIVDVHVTPLLSRRGRLNGRLIVMRDITRSKKIEADLQQANRRLEARLVEIKVMQNRLQDQANRDSLTGLFNRRFLEEVLEKEIAQASLAYLPVSLVMIDIDHFKILNDTLGHKAGDIMLCKLSNLLMANCRKGDFVCRYGGEEFVVVMPGASLKIAIRRAEAWRRGVEELTTPGERGDIHITISLGVAAFPEAGKDPSALLQAVDDALYQAKSAGRNCVRPAG